MLCEQTFTSSLGSEHDWLMRASSGTAISRTLVQFRNRRDLL